MKNSINLVSKRQAPNRFHKRFFIAGLSFFSVTFLLSVGVIGYQFLLSEQLATLKSEESVLISQVNSDPEKKIKFLTIRERLTEIQKVIARRQDVNSRINAISEVVPGDIGINVIEGDEEEMRVRVAADNLSSLNNLIEERIEEFALEQGKTVKRIEMTSFGLNSNSLLYEATFVIEFNS